MFNMKPIFKDKLMSYFLISACGVLAGFAVVLHCELPDNELWSFYYWSASTFGFWMFSTSLIVLFSENRKCAAVNSGIYIFLMFFITTAYKSLSMFREGLTPFQTLGELTLNSITGWLLYSIMPAVVCAVLGLVLWSGRKNTVLGKILRLLPMLFITAETIVMLYYVLTTHTKLFSALTNLLCLAAYILIYFFVMCRALNGEKNHKQQG